MEVPRYAFKQGPADHFPNEAFGGKARKRDTPPPPLNLRLDSSLRKLGDQSIAERFWVDGVDQTARSTVLSIRRWTPLMRRARGTSNGRPSRLGFGFSLTALTHTIPLRLRVSTMDPKPQRKKGHDDALSKLNEAIEDLNRAKEVSNVTPAKTVFGSTSALLPKIRVSSVSIRRLLANLCRIPWAIGRVTSN